MGAFIVQHFADLVEVIGWSHLLLGIAYAAPIDSSLYISHGPPLGL